MLIAKGLGLLFLLPCNSHNLAVYLTVRAEDFLILDEIHVKNVEELRLMDFGELLTATLIFRIRILYESYLLSSSWLLSEDVLYCKVISREYNSSY